MCLQPLIFTLDFDDDFVQAGVAGEDASMHAVIVHADKRDRVEWGATLKSLPFDDK